jgi:hypothetical protein
MPVEREIKRGTEEEEVSALLVTGEPGYGPTLLSAKPCEKLF